MKNLKWASGLAVKVLIASLCVFIGAFILTQFSIGENTAFFLSTVLLVLSQFIKAPAGALRSGLYPELWTGELVDKFRFDKQWLSLVPRRDDLVKNNTIHLVDVGVDPNVLINNTTYPIASAGRTDADIALSLDKFDTENTDITDDELYNLPYDKPGSVIQDHRLALEDKVAAKSAHSLAPTSGKADGSTPNSPIVLTTGSADGRQYGRKRLVPHDLIRAKESLDNLYVPQQGRVLLLDYFHFNDLLELDEKFEKQWIADKAAGNLMTDWYGFKIGQNFIPPVYTESSGTYTKKAFGASSTPASEQRASLFFLANRAIQAVGTANMYYRESAISPEYRKSTVGFRLYQMCLMKKSQGFGAIISAPSE